MKAGLANLGRSTQHLFATIGGCSLLFWESAKWSWRILNRKTRFQQPVLFYQMVRVGFKSLGIVTLVLFFVGMILAFQLSGLLRTYGVVEYVADVVGASVFRELGPLLSCIVMSGFVGASFAAELGSMVVGEEVEALKTQAIDPIRFLVVPRLWAVMITVPCLVLFADLVGAVGGFVIGQWALHLDPSQYWIRTFDAVRIRDLFQGLLKGEVFGIIITMIACHHGLRVRGGAGGVGRAATQTVVQSIVAIIVADLMFAAIFFSFE